MDILAQSLHLDLFFSRAKASVIKFAASLNHQKFYKAEIDLIISVDTDSQD